MLKKISLYFLICFLTLNTYAAKQYGSVTVSKVISVYDGDTFRVNIDSLPPIVGKNIPVRLEGVDTPEINGKCQYEKDLALEARDFVRSKLSNAVEILLNDLQRGKYFRIVAKVYIDGVSLEEELLQNGLAYQYNGGKKSNWCK
jgi:micrococcal nuclease